MHKRTRQIRHCCTHIHLQSVVQSRIISVFAYMDIKLFLSMYVCEYRSTTMSIHSSLFLFIYPSIYYPSIRLSTYLICGVISVLWHINLCRVISRQSYFHTNKPFHFKEFSLARQYSLIVKNISISSYSVHSNSSN